MKYINDQYEFPLQLDLERDNDEYISLDAGDLLKFLDVSSDENTLPTTYGELRPPPGKHCLNIVEFIIVPLRMGSEVAQQELVKLGAIQMIIHLFFYYPFNNSLHHQVERFIVSCLEKNNTSPINHLF